MIADSPADIAAHQAALILNNKKPTNGEDEEMIDLLSKQNCS